MTRKHLPGTFYNIYLNSNEWFHFANVCRIRFYLKKTVGGAHKGLEISPKTKNRTWRYKIINRRWQAYLTPRRRICPTLQKKKKILTGSFIFSIMEALLANFFLFSGSILGRVMNLIFSLITWVGNNKVSSGVSVSINAFWH